MERHDVVVVGAGVMGLASAWALTRAGRRVTVLEQFEIGHPFGSSHGESRIFRLAYDDPEWIALAQQALVLWRELETETGEQLLSPTGLLDARPDSSSLRAALEAAAVEHELLAPGDAKRRYGINLDGEVVLEPHGGTVRADRALAAFVRNIRVEAGARVTSLTDTREAARLETTSGTIEADLAVVAAGAWATPLLASAGIELETSVTRETVAYFEVDGAARLPSVIDWNDELGRHVYLLASGENVLKAGVHQTGAPAVPDGRSEADPTVVAAVSTWMRQRVSAAGRPLRAETCLYTNIERDRFVIERHGSIVVCSACSGHGFKFAPAIGLAVSELV